MKRKAILIGNNRSIIGVNKDLQDFRDFLLSYSGGAWNNDEIIILLNQSSSEVKSQISSIKTEGNDYVIVYFTGHGGLKGDTIIEINPSCEQLLESELFGISPKQINILDCCRVVIAGTTKIDGGTSGSTFEDERNSVRAEFESLILSAAPQFVKIYSCSEGEESYAPSSGSYYTQSLLTEARNYLNSNKIASIYKCHENASIKTIALAKSNGHAQTPQIVPAKCLLGQELPFSFIPTCLIPSK